LIFIEQNNNIEFVASETLKKMEELDLDKENGGGVHFLARRAFEAMLLAAAAAENNIADGVKYIKNSEMIQNQLQMLTQ
jgi:hypothetical protein